MMKDQWESMAGMAGMFIVTIGIGIFIQPLYDIPEARAYGDEGTTQSSFILLQLLLIGIFTVAIIWLARKGLEHLIKGIVLLALALSLFHAIQPFTLLILYIIGFATKYSVVLSAVAITIASIVALLEYPEWWVVNSVGVMVGSGVIVLIGISFVPTLVIIFMVLAAIYDYWAVHKSKHMLELADTMIDLKLPVLLVAPKEKGYSFLEQEGDIMQDSPPPLPEGLETEIVDEERRMMSKKKSRDALFMGLGDVIFPGMLVISAITFLPDWGQEIWNPYGDIYLAQLLVAIGTLIGGLIGYVLLMAFVAQGNPQPGLPLLNGGAILGYIISAILTVGPEHVFQAITFL
jgi:presenilin-like A22 family membrane protease|tara:strand:- start:328 stop:1368 length:1041 start_codon:yes stop_codon:yes gene_type:complete